MELAAVVFFGGVRAPHSAGAVAVPGTLLLSSLRSNTAVDAAVVVVGAVHDDYGVVLADLGRDRWWKVDRPLVADRPAGRIAGEREDARRARVASRRQRLNRRTVVLDGLQASSCVL